MNPNVLGLRNGILTRTNNDNNNFYINFTYDRKYNTNLLYNTDLHYNPFTQTLTCPNFIGNITANKVEVTDSDYNGNLKLTFSDGNNNLLDNAGLLYHPFFRILKVESNNSQTYQLLLKNSGQSAGIQIKGAPAVTQYEANITHYLDILKIQNTGSDTEIEQVGSGTIYIYNANGSLTLNGSGNIVASGIYAGNGSLLTSLTTANLNGLVQNNQLQNDTITIGSTTFNLGDTLTALSGLTSVTSDLFDGKIYIEERTDSKNYSLLFSVIPLGVDNERLINTDTNIYWNPFLSTLTCYRLDGYATGLELQTFSNIKPFVFCDGGIVTTQSVYTTSSNDLCWDNNNKRLGIGNANPQNKLDVVGGIISVNNSASTIQSYLRSDSLELGINQSTDNVSYIDFHATPSVDGNFRIIRNAGANGTVEFNNSGTGDLIFYTNSAPKMYIKSSGNVGIGGDPLYKCHIQETSSGSWGLLYNNSTDGVEQGLYASAGGGWCGTKNNVDMRFGTNFSTRMTIDTSGNVGIGKINPNYTLDVAGKVFSNNGFYTPTYTSGGNHYFGAEYLTRIVAGMEIEHTTLTGNYSQKLHFRTHHFAISEGRRMTIDEDGNVGIGTINPYYKLDITGTTHSRNNIYIAADDALLSRFLSIEHATSTPSTARFIECLYNQTEIGSCTQNGTTAVLWNTTSDYRVKENVVDCDDGYNKVLSLRPINFNYKGDNFKNTGFIAHEIQKIIPEIVCGDFDDVEDYCVNCKRRCDDCNCKNCDISSRPKLQQLDYGKITPFLVHSIQVLTKKIDELNKENDELKKENENMKKEIDELKENQKKIIQKLNKLLYGENCWFQNSI